MDEKQKIPIVPVVTGEVFLHDRIKDEQHCYICKQEVNKFDAKDIVLVRIAKGLMGLCCTKHKGVVQEFIKQFDRLPYGWEVNEKTTEEPKPDIIS